MYPYGISSPQIGGSQWGLPYGLSMQQGYPGIGGSSYGYPLSQQGGQQSVPGSIGVEGSVGQGLFGQQEFGGMGTQSGQYLSPQEFTGSLGRQQQARVTGLLNPVEAIFITELSRSARGLQEVAEQLEGRDQDAQRKGYFAATAHLFYVFGILSSKGILIPSDISIGRSRTEGTGAASACREFGRVLDRVVDKVASGRGLAEELSSLIERGKICYSEVTRGIETQGTGAPAGREEQPEQKKRAA